MDATVRRTLRSLARTRSRAELKALFAAIRQHDDAALLDIAAPAGRTRRAGDFGRAIADRLSPIVAPADEKGGLLADMLAEMLDVAPLDRIRGLAPTVRRLAAQHGEKAVAAAADALLERLRDWGSTRERVK